jgi:hypothetical protein
VEILFPADLVSRSALDPPVSVFNSQLRPLTVSRWELLSFSIMTMDSQPSSTAESVHSKEIQTGANMVSDFSGQSSVFQSRVKPLMDLTRGQEQTDEKVGETHNEPITKTESAKERDHVYLEGWKLYAVLISTTLVFFLVLMDMSILATVSGRLPCRHAESVTDSPSRPSRRSRISSIHYRMSAGMVRLTILQGSTPKLV